MLVQSKFMDKARKAYACMGMKTSIDYRTVKEALKNCENRSRRRFRGVKKLN